MFRTFEEVVLFMIDYLFLFDVLAESWTHACFVYLFLGDR